jgi:hypothetical protein
VPGDLVTKGADFLSEAERLRGEESQKLSLAYLQGTLLLYERCVHLSCACPALLMR